jgi:integrase
VQAAGTLNVQGEEDLDLTDPFVPFPEEEIIMAKENGGETKPSRAHGYIREAKEIRTFSELYEWRKPSFGRYVAPQNVFRRFELHALPLLGHHTAETLLPEHIEAAIDILADKGLRADYLNKIRSDGLRLIRDAIANRKWDGGNPFEAVKPRRIQEPDYATLTADEAREVLGHVRPDMQNLFAFMIYLGPRPGEAVALQKGDVDLVRMTADVVRSHERDTTKTGRKRRNIPIPDELRPYVEDAMRKSKGALVFPSPDGGMYRFDFKFSRVLRGAMILAGVVLHWTMKCRRKGCGFSEVSKSAVESFCVRCNMRLWAVPTPRPIRFYDLRHTAASLHEAAGCKPIAYKKALGWAAQDVSEKTYVHLTLEEWRSELNKMTLQNSRQKPATPGQNQERRKGFEPSTPSLGRSGSNRRAKNLEAATETSSTSAPQPAERDDSRPHITRRYISVADLSERWGVSHDFIYKCIEAGRIPYMKLGALYRFDIKLIEAREKLGGIQ